MSSSSIDMREYFRGPSGGLAYNVPMNAHKFGLVIQDRKLRGSAYGLRKNQIPFQYLESGDLPQLTKSANYDDTSIPGRFENIKMYNNSNNIQFSLNLMYCALGTERVSLNPKQGADQHLYSARSPWTQEQIARISAKFESLVYPRYDVNFAPPPYCLLNIGSIFIDFPVVITSVSVGHKGPFSVRDLTPRLRSVTLECTSYFPIYQSIGNTDILKAALEGDFVGSSFAYPRKVYSFKKFTRSMR